MAVITVITTSYSKDYLPYAIQNNMWAAVPRFRILSQQSIQSYQDEEHVWRPKAIFNFFFLCVYTIGEETLKNLEWYTQIQ